MRRRKGRVTAEREFLKTRRRMPDAGRCALVGEGRHLYMSVRVFNEANPLPAGGTRGEPSCSRGSATRRRSRRHALICSTMRGILAVTLPVYPMMGTGAFLRKTGMLPQEADKGLMKLKRGCFDPCAHHRAWLATGGDAADARADGRRARFALVVLGISLSYAVARLIGLRVHEGRRTFGVSARAAKLRLRGDSHRDAPCFRTKARSGCSSPSRSASSWPAGRPVWAC